LRRSPLARRAQAAAARSRVFGRFVDMLERVVPPQPGRLTVLTYHRVDEERAAPLLYPGLLSATPEEFDAQMRHVKTRYRPLSLAELRAVRRNKADLPTRAVLVTFDDAYCDFAVHAWPTLRELGVPVTVFVPTAFPNTDRLFWWDRVWAALGAAAPDQGDRLARFRALRTEFARLSDDELRAEVDRLTAELRGPAPSPSVLGWEALRSLAQEGVELAPHTRTHPRLDRAGRDAVREELAGARRDLEREIGSVPPALAYPGGGHDPRVVEVAAELGFELGFTTERGGNDIRRADWLRLRRINVGRRLGHEAFRAQLLPWWRSGSLRSGPDFRSAVDAARFRPRPGSERRWSTSEGVKCRHERSAAIAEEEESVSTWDR
jgi:peptidoglycan/xylan/chitin deacetylase (PgdA/CDA1 family)